MNPYVVVEELEKRIAEWAGAPYAVAVESCSAAIFLCLQWYNIDGRWNGLGVECPSRTYPSIPASIIHAGMKVEFKNYDWEGEYCLWPTAIWDAALRFRKGMYHGGYQCISGHIKKRLNVGRLGMILLDDEEAYNWLKLARFDGREAVPLKDQKEFTVLGYNMYLEPSNAARAIQIFETLRDKDNPDLSFAEQGYADLSLHKIYQQ
jgi:dTDP-4-amino-4,6-dideoxygalactose transaminase